MLKKKDVNARIYEGNQSVSILNPINKRRSKWNTKMILLCDRFGIW